MAQDSGGGSQRSAPRRDGRAHPQHELDEQPPTGTVNPLPRRSAQEHMEPQLRRAGGAGGGTTFSAFNPFAVDSDAVDDEAGHDEARDTAPDPGDEPTVAAENTRAAEFNKGSRRGRRRTAPPAS